MPIFVGEPDLEPEIIHEEILNVESNVESMFRHCVQTLYPNRQICQISSIPIRI